MFLYILFIDRNSQTQNKNDIENIAEHHQYNYTGAVSAAFLQTQ